MAKKRITNYVFSPGIASSDNLYPDAYSLIQANKQYIKKEAVAYIGALITSDTAVNFNPFAVALLTNNKTFLQDEITAWIKFRVDNNIGIFAGYTYDAEKCKRDVGYVIDSYIYDLRYGGNEQTRDVAKKYWLNGVPQVDGSRAQEVAAHTQLRDIITNFIFTRVTYTSQQSPVTSTQNTSGTSAESVATTLLTNLTTLLTNVISNGLSVIPADGTIIYPNAASLLQNNKIFLQEEITAYIAYEVENADKCERDIGYIIDGVGFDVALGTNYNSVFLGLANVNSLDRSGVVNLTILDAKSKVAALSAVSSTPLALSRANASFDEVANITLNGRSAADPVTFTNPTNASASAINAKNRLIANKGFITAEINAWVNVTFPAHDHDIAKCTRDVNYAIDSFCYDILYGGNSATYDNAKFFFYSGASGITPAHKTQTVEAYLRLKTIIGQIVEGVTVTKSSGNNATQDLSGDSALSSESLALQALAQLIADVVDNGVSSLPATRIEPNVSWAASGLQAAKAAIDSNKLTIVSQVVAFKNYTYDTAKCKRDVGYILDAYLYDLSFGGNEKTIETVSKYWSGSTPQVDGNRLPEVYAHTKLKEIITGYIFTGIEYTFKKSTATQYIYEFVGETAATTRINDLSSTVVNVIRNGLGSLPGLVTSTGANYSTRNFAGYVYDPSKCERDINYVLDAYLHDLRYGGNAKTRVIVSRYWEGSKPQVDGDRKPEIVTHQFIRDLINNYIIPQLPNTSSYQTQVSQTLNPNLEGELAARARVTDLTYTVTSVIQNGLLSIPPLENGVTTVKFIGKYDFDKVLLITNTSTNQVLYNFSDPATSADIDLTLTFNSNGFYKDEDFQGYLGIADYVTVIYLNADTSTRTSDDRIQIFVEEDQVTVRPWDFGTDAIERMRVASPQSMLDADFEYGLQPTKWQAIGISRGYPSVYEIPGSDTQVLTVTTDASVGTAGVGQSLITVTTNSPHGFTPGTPITIRALANTISGFSRAEGTFIILAVPTSTTFTYYATAKVGTANGQVLATTYTQLRRGAFYTGASVGAPTFNVASNGTSTTFQTQFLTLAGSDQFAWTGSILPAVGSPLTAAGLPTGAQVTGVVGPGGIAVTANILNDVNINDTSIDVVDTSNILEGMAIDNGSGTAIFVTGIQGNSVEFTGSITNFRLGQTATYTNVSGTNIQPTGSGATFAVNRVSGEYFATLQSGGLGFVTGNRVRIPGTSLGGASPTNDLILTAGTVDASGTILTFTQSGTSVSGGATYTGVTHTAISSTYVSIAQTSTSGSGTGALFDVTRTLSAYSATLSLTDNSAGYASGDTIVLSGTQFVGTAPANNVTITVSTVDGSGKILTFSVAGTVASVNYVTKGDVYNNLSQDATSGAGANALFNVTRRNGAYTVTITSGNEGTGYAATDTVTINGLNLGGTSPTNNLTITVTTVGLNGEITGFTFSGTAALVASAGSDGTFDITRNLGTYTISIDNVGSGYLVGDDIIIRGTALGGTTPTNNLVIQVTDTDINGGITDYILTGTSIQGDQSFGTLPTTTIAAIGTGATFNVTRTAGAYSATVNGIGTNYYVGDTIKILGTSLGGTTPANDAIVSVTLTSGTQISTIAIDGSAITGTTVEFYSGITFSELTTANIPSGTTVQAAAIAQIEIIFQSPHGLVPGAAMIIDITSSGTNHDLARGPFYVEQVPSLTTIRYTTRAAGTVDTLVPLTGIVYSRPDSYFIHRPYDGGVLLGTGGPQHGSQAIRMSKKYIRYQSGKGVMYTTGALFAPSYNLQNLSANGISIGSYITVQTDDVDHGCQVGGVIRIIGVETGGYNGVYRIADVVNERTFRVQATSVLSSTVATLGSTAQMSILSWHGATVKAGTFDDQNGMFWQYDGQYLAVTRRSSTFQIAGVVDIARDSNLMTGTNTRFRDQLKAGDRIVIKGMTHVVSNVISNTQISVTPDYRGAGNALQAKVCLVQDFTVTQPNFNRDKLDGTGPSGYNLDISKMQMIGLQWSWYGAGFIDYMLRGSDGNYVFAHRIRNSNTNTEAYMRTGNLPVRYEVINESANGRLASSITATQNYVPLDDATYFPNESGIVYIDNEMIAFSGKSGNNLVGCTRASPMTNFVGGAQRTFRAGGATTHEVGTGVVLISNTISPIISHWGSAFLTDGLFDEDRGYLFNYASTGISISTTKATAFLIRLAPSVSNAIVGDLGERELLNRAQLLLKGIEVTSDTGTGGIVVEGVLNPQNYPTNPGDVQWSGLAGLAAGGQPSFAQVAPGGSINWSGGALQTTANATALNTLTANATVPNATAFNRPIGSSFVYVTQTSWNATGATSGFAISTADTKFQSGTTVTTVASSPSPVATTLGSIASTMTIYGQTLTTTSGNGNGTTTTLFFGFQSFTPFPIGSTISVSGASPAGANGTFTVTNAGQNFVQYASTFNGSLSQNGTIQTRFTTGSTTIWVTRTSWEAMTNPVSATGFTLPTTYFPPNTRVTAVSGLQGTGSAQFYIVTASAGLTAPLTPGLNLTMNLGGAYTNTNILYFTSASWNALPVDVPVVGTQTNDTGLFASGTVINSISSLRTFGTTGYYAVGFSNASVGTVNAAAGVTFATTPYFTLFLSRTTVQAVNANATVGLALAQNTANTNFVYVTQSSWETLVSSNSAGNGTELSDAKFPAGTRISSVSQLRTFGGTNYYTLTFTQTSNAVITGGATIAFRFGLPPFALPGEQVFSFIANPGERSSLDLSELKELTNTALGGRGTFPNGPDVLAINVYKVSGAPITANLIVRWGEAQA